MKNKFLYIFALLLILSACKKEGNSYVKGTITETGSNAPMEGVEVTLFKNTNSKSDILVKSVKTDAMGKYILPYSKEPGADYTVKCSYKNYIAEENLIGKDLDMRKEAVNFVLIPLAYIKFRYIKTSSSTNSIIGKYVCNNKMNSYFFPGIRYAFATQAYDSIPPKVHVVYGNNYVSLEWGDFDLNASGEPVFTKTDKVYINKGDTLLYSIIFN